MTYKTQQLEMTRTDCKDDFLVWVDTQSSMGDTTMLGKIKTKA